MLVASPNLGADVLRLWVAAEDYRGDVKLSKEILGHLVEAYRRVRNTARFLLGNLGGFDPQRGNDEVIRLRYEDAMRWLREIHAGKLRPVGMAGTTTPEASSAHAGHPARACTTTPIAAATRNKRASSTKIF